jgi:hypothetical protein
MTPFRWKVGHREYVGLLHEAAVAQGRASARPHAVLICNAFGQEALRSYRMLRLLADRLARAGHVVLRFDYYGTGDSGGGCDEFGLPQARDDIAAADLRLKAHAPGLPVCWIGLRAGANLAMDAAGSPGAATPNSLVLWDPIVDGEEYLQELARSHVSYLEREFGMPWSMYLRRKGMPAGYVPRDEVFGFAMPPALRAQFSSLRLAGSSVSREVERIALLSDRRPEFDFAAEPWVRSRWLECPRRDSWNSEAAISSAQVPQAFLVHCMDWLS